MFPRQGGESAVTMVAVGSIAEKEDGIESAPRSRAEFCPTTFGFNQFLDDGKAEAGATKFAADQASGTFTTNVAISAASPPRMSSRDAPRQFVRVRANASESRRSARSAAWASAVVSTASSATT